MIRRYLLLAFILSFSVVAVEPSPCEGRKEGEGKADRSGIYRKSVHGNPGTGLKRFKDLEAGECEQCHTARRQPGAKFESIAEMEFCYFCHREASDEYPAIEGKRGKDGFFDRGRWPGKKVYESSRHWKSGALIYPGKKYEPGDCKNCHNPHGSENKAMLKAPYVTGDYRLCFDCHGAKGSAIIMRDSARFIESYYTLVNVTGSAPGHRITFSPKQRNDFSASKLSLGDTLPCYDCHNPHGSQGGRALEPNGYHISDQRPEWDGLTDLIKNPSQARRFCLGCHVESDGTPFSREVEGIRMNRIPKLEGVDEHGLAGTASCYQCHGGDYSTEVSVNVHNVGYGK